MLPTHTPGAKCIVETGRAFRPAPCLRCTLQGVSITLLMQKWLPQLLTFCFASLTFGATTGSAVRETQPAVVESPADVKVGGLERAGIKKVERVYVIPVREQIGSAVLYIIRRGIKEAIEQKAGAIILDMDTPGGSLGTTLEIMEAIGKFPGTSITYVNNEAISAGAFIAATTQEI